MSVDSFGSRSTLVVGERTYEIFRLDALPGTERLPYSIKVLLENLLRTEDGLNITADSIRSVAEWDAKAEPSHEVLFTPARVLLQDFTGVPAIVDLAAMRDAMTALGGDPAKVNPLMPADLVIDHSIIAEVSGVPDAFLQNARIEFDRNLERYTFLRWGQTAFDNFRVVPPNTGIVHQVNLEYLAPVVMTSNGQAYPDTLVGLDSHTTMINGLGVLGWGVGGIEAEAAMLGQPVSMLIPQVVGFRLEGQLREGATATDLVLTIAQMLRAHGVVGKFVEFFGDGVGNVPLANRATIGNMSPEYGSTAAMFPIDEQTLRYLHLTGRSEEQIALVEAYARAQGLFHDPARELEFSEVLTLDLGSVEPSLAGPSRPQDRVRLSDMRPTYLDVLPKHLEGDGPDAAPDAAHPVTLADGRTFDLLHGSVLIAAITSCTNTSNPSVMVAAGLLAKKAVEHGLVSKPWVKTTLAPGSKVVTDYYDRIGLTPYLEKLGFHTVGYGCTTCIGNSGALAPQITDTVREHSVVTSAVLSGNRNFEARINPDIKLNFLASPPLVVAYAIAGTVDIDLVTASLGTDAAGKDVFLRDIWPTDAEIEAAVQEAVQRDMFVSGYAAVFAGDERWQSIDVPQEALYTWRADSSYVQKAPYFEGMQREPTPVIDIVGARALAKLGDSITTDHISPAGSISLGTPPADYLLSLGVEPKDFNSLGSRRGNHEVMMRGTFANVRLKNQLAPGTTGGLTRHFPSGEQMSIFDAAMRYRAEQVPLVVLGGREYGSGSSRDWAAKGPALLGIRAVLVESFERIHRSNLIGMGIVPIELPEPADALGIIGDEQFDIVGLAVGGDGPGGFARNVEVTVRPDDGRDPFTFSARVRIDTPNEAEYYRHGGILQYVLRQLAAA